MIWLAVFLRILANPFSNVFQKVLTRKSADPLFIIFATHALLSVVCLPICLYYVSGLSRAVWLNISISAVLAVIGNALIVQAMKWSDLSVLGPINAYKSIVSLVPGMVLLHEFPGRLGASGMALIVAGSYFLVDKNVKEPTRNLFVRFFSEKGVQYRFIALIVSAVEAIFLKRALFASSPLIAFAFWSVLGCGVSLAAVAVMMGGRVRQQIVVFRASQPAYLMLFVTTGLMQLCTLITLKELKVGYALALFQTSTLLSVVLGYKVFQERNILERLIGSMVMVAGAALIIIGR
jgi:drug/metabolite transporter (DMT)-like permease